MQSNYKPKVIYLIDPSKFEKRNILSQQEFESRNFDFLKFFESEVYSSFKELHSKFLSHFKPDEYDSNFPAVTMVSLLRRSIIRAYPTYCRRATPHRFKLITPTDQYLFIKKLDENFMPMNIQTQSNDKILFQCSEGDESNPYIFLGYTEEEKYAIIKGVFAVCIADKKIQWRTDISNLSDEQGAWSNIDNTPVNPKLKDGVLRIKTNKNE